MTKIKLCGLTRPEDIEAVNALRAEFGSPDYTGFVFAKKSRRYVSPETASLLRSRLDPRVVTVGVFVREPVESVADLYRSGIIGAAQLHGGEDAAYIEALRALVPDCPLIHAFRVDSAADVARANRSPADFVLVDHGAGGTGTAFDWTLLDGMTRPYFLAGGLSPDTVGEAIPSLHPNAADVSSGIETDGAKDAEKMRRFVLAAAGGQDPI